MGEEMKNYRIKKVIYNDTERYYPQQKIIAPLWWRNIFGGTIYSGDGGYATLEEAQEHLCNYLRKPVVEYIDFDCERDCK
jgi:hypothetical protein